MENFEPQSTDISHLNLVKIFISTSFDMLYLRGDLENSIKQDTR